MPCTRSARPITTEAATVSDPGGAVHREVAASTEEVAHVASTAATATTTATMRTITISEASAAPTMAIIGATREEAVDTEIKTTITITMLVTEVIIGATETPIKTITIGSSPKSTMAMKTTTITTMAMT